MYDKQIILEIRYFQYASVHNVTYLITNARFVDFYYKLILLTIHSPAPTCGPGYNSIVTLFYLVLSEKTDK